MYQLVHVILIIDTVHTVPLRALDCGPGDECILYFIDKGNINVLL